MSEDRPGGTSTDGAPHRPSAGTSGEAPSRRRRVRSSQLRTAERRRRVRRRARSTLSVLAVLALLMAPALVLVRDVLVVRDALVGAESDLRGARDAVVERDVDGAAASSASASLRLEPAEARVATRRFTLAASLPRLGAPLTLVSELVGTARAGLDVADALLVPEVLEGLSPRVRDGLVDLAPLVAAAALLEAAPIGGLADAVARLERVDTRLAPAELLAARNRLLGLSRPLVTNLERSRDVAAGLPTFLGADGPRRHLVVLQTSGLLRGTGGMVGVLAVLEVDGGRLSLGEARAFEPPATRDAEDAATDAPEGPDARPGARAVGLDALLLSLPGGADVPMAPAFEARYGFAAPTSSLTNINIEPDLPTTGALLLDLYEARTGVALDGLVLLDPIGLQALMVALDAPLVLPPELVAGTGAPVRVAPRDLARFVLVDLYTDFGADRERERDAVAIAFATQALGAVFERSWDAPAVAAAFVDAAAGRHVQVFTRHAPLAAALARTPAGGAFAGALGDPLVDVFAVTHNNAVGGKQDVHVSHATSLRIVLAAPDDGRPLRQAMVDGAARLVRDVRREVTLRTTVTNPLTADAFDLYITGNCIQGAPPRCFDGVQGDHRTWLNVWLGSDDRVVAVRDRNGSPSVRTGMFHGVQVVDATVDVASLDEAFIEVASDGLGVLELRPDGGAVYRLGWWRQAKGIPDVVDIDIAAPPGWEVMAVRTTGGARRLPLLGPDASPGGLVVARRADGVHLSGTIASDLTVEVELRPAR